MEVWFVGVPLMCDNEEIGWMPEGIYVDEAEAVANAKDGEFIVVGEIGERLPVKATDARKFYYPTVETWEESKMYKMRCERNR